MPDAIANLTQGLPVEIGRIDREFKRLWQEGEGAATRASLMNFAVYCHGADCMRQTTEVIAQLTQDHACRAILIAQDPNTPGSGVQAWISAHCHVSRAGAKQLCCEQISFLIGRDGQALIPNIVFSHLDSDLPLVLWWRGDLPADTEDQLWTWVDRLLFDSQGWTEPGDQFQLLRTSIIPASPRMTLCDLNWARSLYLRQAVAQLFDHPEHAAELGGVDGLNIVHGPGMRTTAMLLAGWVAAQLQWRLDGAEPNGIRYLDARGNRVTVTLREEAGKAIGSVELRAGETSFLVSHREGSEFLYADVHLSGNRETHCLMPGGKEDLVALLNEELMAGGKHKVYMKAVGMIEGALG